MDYPVDSESHADLTRRDVVVRFGAGSLAALLLAAARTQPGLAQDATPPAPVGVSMQMMGSGQPDAAPGMELSLRRITIAPGGSVPAHSHPGALVIFVEAGTWGYTHLGGEVQLHRAAGEGIPTAAEEMPVGEEVTLTAGDWLFVEDPQDDVRNVGDDDVVLLIAGLTPVGEPFTTFMTDMEMEATPAG